MNKRVGKMSEKYTVDGVTTGGSSASVSTTATTTSAKDASTSPSSSSPLRILTDLVLVMIMGFCFGFLFERSHVYEPTMIRQQFLFQKWVMIKMFMGAVAGACLSFYIWHKVDPDRIKAIRQAEYLYNSILDSAWSMLQEPGSTEQYL